ncbi:RNA-binding domain-containing protein [Tilletiopsis washingtonensis]|uniref:RNA-binding domain-containing protein n=1 Tax=Tilletiopsis washingtonensis TaxID=58919 RepID=A0A316ZHC5_9BASI|nr:RNA-binding domain-containing protein [Tilletiopsis washingtonensis]PWO00900.1 RNA-binding domain-containing protein [Tilletiopsis washingtonensis]
MAERTKKTVYVGGLPDGADAAMLVNAFTAFGEVVDVQIPQEDGNTRGFGFVTFSKPEEAEDAIDNMHLNELAGRIINVNLARAPKAAIGNGNRPVWEDEEWIKEHAAPLEGAEADEAPEGP